MAKKQPTKQTKSGSKSRPKTQNKTEAAAPPKVVMGHTKGVIMKDATMTYHEVGPIEPLKIEVNKPMSSSTKLSHGDARQLPVFIKDIASAYSRITRVEGSTQGPVVRSASGNKLEMHDGQAPPISN